MLKDFHHPLDPSETMTIRRIVTPPRVPNKGNAVYCFHPMHGGTDQEKSAIFDHVGSATTGVVFSVWFPRIAQELSCSLSCSFRARGTTRPDETM